MEGCSHFLYTNYFEVWQFLSCFLHLNPESRVSVFCFLFCRNYVVQFILELEIPSAIRTLISEFEGNYVHLSIQKFSSHVVEKCLHVFDDESRSRIIHELLSASPFEQLLQDPHANYVIQTALRVSEVGVNQHSLSQHFLYFFCPSILKVAYLMSHGCSNYAT